MEENIRSIKSEFDKTIKSKNPDKLFDEIKKNPYSVASFINASKIKKMVN